MRKLCVILTILSVVITAYAQGTIGTWNGNLNLGTMKLPLVFHIGDNSCTLDSPNQGAKGIPGKVNFQSADSISVAFESLGGSYVGKLQEGKLKGTFTQMGYRLSLELEKGELVRLRPQTPRPPFPYQTEEVIFVNEKDTASLAGTLTWPVGYQKGKKVPVVLMITGSGMQNRDEEIFDHKPFAVIADYLARHGVASLRYDDRQVGGSKGNVTHATTEDFMRDAEAGLKYLKELKSFSRIGVLGHSEGGTIAFMLAKEKKPDFIVSLAGTGLRGDSVITEQTNFILRQQGKPGNMTVKQMHLTMMMTKTTPWYDFFVSYDPAEAIQKVKCPALILNGSKDSQVLAESNLNVIRNLLPKNSKSKIKEYPGLNHLFQPCKTGAVDEYGTIEQTISEEVLADIAEWIQTL
ncbi:MAG: dienelactone hydrolase family protein [Prevotella sp.]|nr:dienelactone hydrolase family protein [Prevotella sp.]